MYSIRWDSVEEAYVLLCMCARYKYGVCTLLVFFQNTSDTPVLNRCLFGMPEILSLVLTMWCILLFLSPSLPSESSVNSITCGWLTQCPFAQCQDTQTHTHTCTMEPDWMRFVRSVLCQPLSTLVKSLATQTLPMSDFHQPAHCHALSSLFYYQHFLAFTYILMYIKT